MTQRSNGFDALRLFAASLVIAGHAFPLTGRVGPIVLGAYLHGIGVKIFFVISGYLIAASWRADPAPLRFWARRILRIFPGLILVCVVTLFVLGPALSTLGPAGFLTAPDAYRYLWNIALYPIYDLPGVFVGQPSNVVNGALWTLPVETAMYAGVALFGLAGARFSAIALPLVAAALLAGSLYWLRVAPPAQPVMAWGTVWTTALDIAPYFPLGAFVAMLGLEKFCRPLPALALAALGALALDNKLAQEVWMALTLPPLAIGLGLRHYRWLKSLDGHDLSYGVYLYGFPIQQSLIHFWGTELNGALNFIAVLGLALLCAALSWRLVERPALALKPARPSPLR